MSVAITLLESLGWHREADLQPKGLTAWPYFSFGRYWRCLIGEWGWATVYRVSNCIIEDQASCRVDDRSGLLALLARADDH